MVFMASALPIILLAGAAIMLMGRGGDDDDSYGGGDGDGDGNDDPLWHGTVLEAGVPYPSLNASDQYGLDTSGELGTKSNPIEYTGSIAIFDAPTVGTNATGTRFRQEFRVGEGENEWMGAEELVSVSTEDASLWRMDETEELVFDEEAARTLSVKNKGATAPGLFSVKWHKGWAGASDNSGTLWFKGKGE